jgi:hypothetical protein
VRLAAIFVVALSCPVFMDGADLAAAPAESDAYRIVLPRRALAAGEHVELRLVPPPPEGAQVNFGMMIGTLGLGFLDGRYRAPYVVPPGTPPVTVIASFSAGGFRASATAEIELTPGSVPGAEDCLGPGQSFSAVLGDIEPGYTQLDELPELLQSVEPEYPRSPYVRGIEDTIHVRALLCRTGFVLDAYALPGYRDTREEPIERDPKLVEAAVAAVRQYVFRPGMVAGHAVALWIDTGVAFRQ